MFTLRAFSVLWLLLLISVHCGFCCKPVEIGEAYNITSTANLSESSKVVWKIFVETHSQENRRLSIKPFPESYQVSKTQVTVFNVTKDDAVRVYQQSVNGTIVYKCTLPVYKRPSGPRCENLTVTENNLTAQCTTDEVFPQAKCQFILRNDEGDQRIIKDEATYIAYTHTDPQTGKNELYSTTCTLQYPADGLEPGNWTVQVKMYPDQTGVSVAQGTVGHAVNDLTLPVMSPKVEEYEDNETGIALWLVGVIVGSVVGAGVLVAVIALIVFYSRRGKATNKDSHTEQRETEYDAIEGRPSPNYQNVKLPDPRYATIEAPGPGTVQNTYQNMRQHDKNNKTGKNPQVNASNQDKYQNVTFNPEYEMIPDPKVQASTSNKNQNVRPQDKNHKSGKNPQVNASSQDKYQNVTLNPEYEMIPDPKAQTSASNKNQNVKQHDKNHKTGKNSQVNASNQDKYQNVTTFNPEYEMIPDPKVQASTSNKNKNVTAHNPEYETVVSSTVTAPKRNKARAKQQTEHIYANLAYIGECTEPTEPDHNLYHTID